MKIKISCFDLFQTCFFVNFDDYLITITGKDDNIDTKYYSDLECLISAICILIDHYGNVIKRVEVIRKK